MSTPRPCESVWETLPVEISLSILKELPDLSSLHCLLNASPAATRVFETHGAEIIEAHLTSGTIHKFTCAIIRIAVHLRSGIVPPGLSGWDSFLDLYAYETTEFRHKPPRWTQPPLKLTPGDFSASVLRSIVASHYHHERLMINCLATYLERFRVLLPTHLVDKDFYWEGIFYGPDGITDNGVMSEYVGSWQQQPPVRPVARHDIGPPTWCEEQRVLRGAWRVQLYEDLKNSKATGLLNSWPLDKTGRWTGPNLDAVCAPGRNASILLYIEPINLIQGWGNDPDVAMQNVQVEEELISSVMEYTEAVRAVDSGASDRPQLTSRTWPEPVPSQKDISEVEWCTSNTALAFQDVAGLEEDHQMSPSSPVQHVPFDFYRRRGFAIWCDARMAGYGLWRPEGQALVKSDWSFSTLLQAWRSVLTEDELKEVARLNQAYEDNLARMRGEYIASPNDPIPPGDIGHGLKFNDDLYGIQGWKQTGSTPT